MSFIALPVKQTDKIFIEYLLIKKSHCENTKKPATSDSSHDPKTEFYEKKIHCCFQI